MNRTFLSLGLFIGVFTIAYGGFFYQKYTSSQGKPETIAITEPPVQAVGNSSAYSDHLVPTKMLTANIDHQSTQRSIKKKSASSGKPEMKNKTQNTANSSSGIAYQTENGRHNLATYKSQTSSSSPRNNLSAFSYTTYTSNNVLQNSSFTTGNGSTDNISTASGISSDVSSRQTTSSTASDGSQNTASTNRANDLAPTSNNITDDAATPETDLWATPNCPAQLANGSTKADANAMQQSYGCRYLKYCRNLNDGKNGFTCWWGFYSS